MAFNINIKNINYSCTPMTNNNNTIAYLCDSRQNVETFKTNPPPNLNNYESISAAGLASLNIPKIKSECTIGSHTIWDKGTCTYCPTGFLSYGICKINNYDINKTCPPNTTLNNQGNCQYKAPCPLGYTLSSTDGYCYRNS